jgi:hypothetical protein
MPPSTGPHPGVQYMRWIEVRESTTFSGVEVERLEPEACASFFGGRGTQARDCVLRFDLVLTREEEK